MTDDPMPREELLEGLLTGDLDPASPGTLRALKADRELRADLQQLQELAEALDGAGAQRRSVLEAARRPVPAPGLERVAPLVEELARGPRRVWPRSLVWPLAAAAAALALWIGARPEPTQPRDSFRPTPAFAPLHPIGAVADYAPFEWSRPAEPTGWFVVRVFSAQDPGESKLIARSPRLSEPSWRPETDDWPDAIRWDVDAHGPDDKHLGVRSSAAERLTRTLR